MVQNNRRLYSKLVRSALDKLEGRFRELDSKLDRSLLDQAKGTPKLELLEARDLLQVPKVNPNFQQVKEHKQLQARIAYFKKLLEDRNPSILPAEVIAQVTDVDHRTLMKQYLKNPEFNSHPLLSLSFNLYSLMNVLA